MRPIDSNKNKINSSKSKLNCLKKIHFSVKVILNFRKELKKI